MQVSAVAPAMLPPQPGQGWSCAEAIDPVAGAEGFCFVSYGLRVGIRVNRPGLWEGLAPHLPPGWKRARCSTVDRLYSLQVEDGASFRAHRLAVDGVERAESSEIEEVLDALESDLQLYVAEHARRRVFVHAGVVAWRGQAILIPGRSFSGKTTLVAALVRAGAVYYSDEYAVLDARGHVHAYPRLLSIRAGGAGQTRRCSPEALGGRAGSTPLPVGLVAVTRYQPGARWRPRTISAGQAALALLDNTVPALRKPAAVLDALQQVVSHALALKGARGEAEPMVEALLQCLDP